MVAGFVAWSEPDKQREPHFGCKSAIIQSHGMQNQSNNIKLAPGIPKASLGQQILTV
jgi:hypothetical protein